MSGVRLIEQFKYQGEQCVRLAMDKGMAFSTQYMSGFQYIVNPLVNLSDPQRFVVMTLSGAVSAGLISKPAPPAAPPKPPEEPALISVKAVNKVQIENDAGEWM